MPLSAGVFGLVIAADLVSVLLSKSEHPHLSDFFWGFTPDHLGVGPDDAFTESLFVGDVSMLNAMAECWNDLHKHVAKCFTSVNYKEMNRDTSSPKSRGEYSDLDNELEAPLYIAAVDAATPEDVDEPEARCSTRFSHTVSRPLSDAYG